MCTCLCIVCYVSASYVHNDRLSRVVCVCIHIYIYIAGLGWSTRGRKSVHDIETALCVDVHDAVRV